MNQFNSKLDRAKNKQKRTYTIFAIFCLTALIGVIILLTISRGTRIELLPVEIKQTAHIKVSKGIGFSIGDTVYSISSSPEVTVTAPGFQDAKERISPAHLGKVFPLELFELPGHLVMVFSNNDTELINTSWLVNGEDRGRGSELDIELPSGNHTIIADNDFYQLKEVPIELQRGEQKNLTIELSQIAGTAHISSTPSGASVFINGKVAGPTPLRIPMGGGSHSVRIVAENYIETIEELIIRRDAPVLERTYQLEREKAKVSFNLLPKGGTLLINGVITTGSIMLDALVSHTITYKRKGYYGKTQKITLKPGEEKVLSFNLQQENGKVLISSSPPAKVFIGKTAYGISPITLNLPAVTQKITLRKDGYREVTKIVTPAGNKDQKVSITLLTEYQARLQEAPREFTNPVGIQLKLFMAQETFIMGAPRSEKGQRANEFQRKILLTKPFYASIYEITNSQFAQFDPRKKTGPSNAPVTSVSWQEAASYCNWLSDKESLLPFYYTSGKQVTGFNPQADGYRLLSEAEWEWLARKSGKPQQTLFSWGNEKSIPTKAANIADESAKGQVRYYVPSYNDGSPAISSVGMFTIESSGLYDQSGNVSEWVHDVYSIIPKANHSLETNPLGLPTGQSHVIKGASWRSGTITTLRPAFREGLSEGQDDIGFRIARYLYGREND